MSAYPDFVRPYSVVAAAELAFINPDDSVEALLGQSSTITRSLNLAMLATLVVGFVATAFNSLDVTIRAPGVIATEVPRQLLHATADGIVERLYVANGSTVRQGDTVLSLAENNADHARSATLIQLDLAAHRRADLRRLVSMRPTDPLPTPLVGLSSSESAASASAALVEWKHGSIIVERAQRARDRSAQLIARGFAVSAEVEAADSELARAREDRMLAWEQRRTGWAEALATAEQQFVSLQQDFASRMTDRSARFIVAPIGGVIEDLAAISSGTATRAGDVIATVSPDGKLVVQALVAPKDVSFLRIGMPARILIEGLDVQTWGAANAIITFVASDYTVANGQPVFRVALRLISEELRRPDGYRTRMSKGLRGQVRFLVGRKRIIDLLRHRASEWMDPSTPGVQ